MTGPAHPAHPQRPAAPGPGAKLWNFIVVVLIFVLVAPLAAALAFMALLVAWLAQFGTEEAAPYIALATMFGAAVSFMVALAPATVAGALFGFWQSFVGRVSWPVAAGVGLALGFSIAAMFDGLVAPEGEKSLLPVFLLSGLAATMAGWLLSRSFVTAGERT